MLRKAFTALIGGLTLATVPAQAAQRPSGEAELARVLQGRVAGEPVDCINLRTATRSRVINGTALLYYVGGTVYVNRPRAGADTLRNWDTQVTRQFGTSRLCSIDTVNMVDPISGTLSGIVFLDEFVPYRRVRN